MTNLSDEEAKVCDSHPIGGRLDACRDALRSGFEAAGLNDCGEIVRLMQTDVDTEHMVSVVFYNLLPISYLPSRCSSRYLRDDILKFLPRIPSGGFNEDATALLLERVMESAPDRDIWSALYDAVNPRINAVPVNADECISGTVRGLYEQWSAAYQGPSLQALKEKIVRFNKAFGPDSSLAYYARIMPIVQSSGTGKSKLVDELAKTYLTISFTLRENGESGYPPGDVEITKFLKQGFKESVALQHIRVVAFLSAAVMEASKRLEGHISGGNDPRGFVLHWQSVMKPVKVDEFSLPKGVSTSEAMSRQMRSDFRKSFCNDVVSAARNIIRSFDPDEEGWSKIFDDNELANLSTHSFVTETLLKPLKELLGRLPEPISNDIPGFRAFFMVDEVSHLIDPNADASLGLFVTFRRVVSFMRDSPVWTFVLSTRSCLDALIPASELDQSSRIHKGALSVVEPFYGLSMDLEASQRLNDPQSGERKKPLGDFARVDHMTMLGRPLWRVYRRLEIPSIRVNALAKLLGGRAEYNPRDKVHVFAVLAARVCLSPCMRNSEANELSQVAVGSHLRLLRSIDVKSGRIATTTPVEPLVSEAAAHTLMSEKCHWTNSLRTLTHSLFAPGLLDPGRAGELSVRIVVSIARDILLKKENARPAEFHYARPFRVTDFLRALFHEDIYQVFAEDPANEKAFESAWMNFVYLTSTERKLVENHGPELLHNLLFAHAGLQLTHNQKSWDLLIPTYFGSLTEDFEPGNTSAILIQVKNRTQRKSEFPLSPSAYKMFSSNGKPVLVIQVEIGVSTSGADMKCTGALYGLHVYGRSSRTFGCLEYETGLATAFEELTKELSPQTFGIEGIIVGQNERFNHHTWGSRFPSTQAILDGAKSTGSKRPQPTTGAGSDKREKLGE